MSLPLVAGDITGRIIGAFYRVYDRLGYGFLEAVYRRSLAHELRKAGSTVHEEAPVGVLYDDVEVGHYRADLLVDRRVIVEIKAGASVAPVDHRQLLNYLRASEVEVGLLLHFGPKPSFHRMMHDVRRPVTDVPEHSVNTDGA